MKKYHYDTKIFTSENDISYYLLGAFMTDGCINMRSHTPVRAALGSVDLDWIEDMKNIICPELHIGKYINSSGTEYHTLSICSKEICQWFISKGCIPNKSLTLQFPNIPARYLPDFIRGCLDGDGSLGQYDYQKIWKNKSYTCFSNQCYLCSASQDFILGYKNYLDNNQIKYGYFVRKPSTNYPTIIDRKIISQSDQHRITISSNNDLNKFLQMIYYPNHKLSMPRKYKMALKIIETTQNYLNKDKSLSLSRKDNISKSLLLTAARGEHASNSKLKDFDIKEIRSLSKTMNVSQIAKKYSVNWNTIDSIIKRKTWKHIA